MNTSPDEVKKNKAREYIVPLADENKAKETLKTRTDAEANRINHYIAMADLSRTPGSPLHEIVSRVRAIPALADFDNIVIPEIIPTNILFDLFNFSADHPARSKSDTYYVTDTHVLRTHDTVMWYYYLNLPEIKEKIARNEHLGVTCYGKVYRKDEIDRKHMNIFHQMGGLFLQPDSEGILPIDELKRVLSSVVEGIFGKDVKYRFNVDTFPYTDPSLEVEVEIKGQWVEILGGGMPRKSVLENFGLKGYNGWAFGFGLERLAIISMTLPDIRLLWSKDPRVIKQLELGHAFTDVSKFPAAVRDISFIVKKDFVPNNYFDLVRDVAPGMTEEVALLDKYENDEKFGKENMSYAYRITYRSLEKTLTSAEVDSFHKKLEEETVKMYNAKIR